MGTFTLTLTFSEKNGTFTSLLWATLLSLLYLNAIQVKNASSTFSGQCAMPIREWFILLSQFCSKAWSNQLAVRWIGSRISLNDSFSSLPHALSRLKRFSLRVVTESLRTSRALSAVSRDLFQEECLCLDTIHIDIFTIFTLAEI